MRTHSPYRPILIAIALIISLSVIELSNDQFSASTMLQLMDMDMDMDMDMNMTMTDNHPHMEMAFHFRENEPILFWEWLPADTTGYVFSCIGVGLISLIYEFLRFIRYKVQSDERKKREGKRGRRDDQENCCCDDETQPIIVKERSHFSSLHSAHHIADSILFFIQLYGSYSLMLIWMTYNVPIVCSSALGHIIGYCILGPLMSLRDEEKIGDCCA